jgi:hypothetical protein
LKNQHSLDKAASLFHICSHKGLEGGCRLPVPSQSLRRLQLLDLGEARVARREGPVGKADR